MIQFRSYVFVLTLFSILCGQTVAGDNDKVAVGSVRKITRVQPEFGDLTEVLKIDKAVATCELNKKVSSCTMRLDFYHKGKKLVAETQRFALSDRDSAAVDIVKCAVHVIDLDYLPLGAGKTGHERIICNLEMGAGAIVGGTSFDIAKRTFDATRGASFNYFTGIGLKGSEVPLFYAIANSPGISTGRDPEDVARLNSEGDVLIAVLELK